MPRPTLLYLALLPLLPIVVYLALPEPLRESYAYWSSDDLNAASEATFRSGSGGRAEGRVKTWRNMGYWKDTDDYSTAAEALGRELLRFADAPTGGRVIDIGHGSGESLLLHLQSTPPPTHLHALTSLSSETRQAQSLVSAHLESLSSDDAQHHTSIQFYTSSAVPRGASDHAHPLHPMRGFMGDSGSTRGQDDDDGEDQYEDDIDLAEKARAGAADATHQAHTASNSSSISVSAPPYDLIYALDAAYHFTPSITAFQSSSYLHLSPGGVLAYTDILPPPSLLSQPLLARAISIGLGVPLVNLQSTGRPYLSSSGSTNSESMIVKGYEDDLKARGYECAEVQEWSEYVWAGFARNLRERGGMWKWVGKVVGVAERDGWKVVAVRIAKPDEGGQCPASFRSVA